MSRIRLVRSITWRPRRCSRLRCWAGERSWLKITNDAPVCSNADEISSTLPLPAKVAGSGRERLPLITAEIASWSLAANCLNSSRFSAYALSLKSRLTNTTPLMAVLAPGVFPAGRSSIRCAGCLKWNVDSPCRYHRGDCVLIHHLGYAVLKQHHILIKRVNMPLQLDPVYQINGNGNMFHSQRVQEWVL